MKNEELLKTREQIDELDGKIAELIEKRVEIAKKVVESKRLSGLEIEDRDRESQIVLKITNGKKSKGLIKSIYKSIFEWVKSDQKK